MLVTRSLGVLKELVRSTEQKVGQVISGPDAVRSGEIEASVCLVGVDRVLLHDSESAAKLPRVASAIPAQCVCESVGVVRLPVHVRVKADDHTAGEKYLCGPKGIVGRYIDSQGIYCRRVGRRNCCLIPTLRSHMEFVENGWGKRLRVSDVRKIIPRSCGRAKPRHVCTEERIENRLFVVARRQRNSIALGCIKIELSEVLIHIVLFGTQGKDLSGRRRWDQPRCSVGLRNGIDLGRIDDRLGGLRSV